MIIRALNYLEKNYLHNADMINCLKRNSADIVCADPDGVMLRERTSGAYMLSADSAEKYQEILDKLDKADLFTVHHAWPAEYAKKKYGLSFVAECFQAVYTGREKMQISITQSSEGLNIRELGLEHTDLVLANYKAINNEAFVRERISSGEMLGLFSGEICLGFIGIHEEGSIGMLEVLSEYRNRGYATALEIFMINKIFENGLIPYTQVHTDNIASVALQRKLGLEFSEQTVYWIG